MPDIAMCLGEETTADGGKRVCPAKNHCYRHMATPTPGRQSYFYRLPLADDGSCTHFAPMTAPSISPPGGQGEDPQSKFLGYCDNCSRQNCVAGPSYKFSLKNIGVVFICLRCLVEATSALQDVRALDPTVPR
jgi:hypothetical protein